MVPRRLRSTITNPNGSTGCSRSTVSPITGNTETDYVLTISHSNITLPRKSEPHASHQSSVIGTTDAANHQYDSHDFFDALSAGNLPTVSYLKAPSYQDAHPSNSNPLDEQAFVVNIVNALEQSPFWNNTAVIIAYDDSDGWYDHQATPVTNGSFSTSDGLTGTNTCGVQGTTRTAGPKHSEVKAAAVPVFGLLHGDFSLGETEFRRPHADHPGFGHPLYRGQLESGKNGRWILRCFGRHHHQHVRLHEPAGPAPNTNLPFLSPVTGNVGAKCSSPLPDGRGSAGTCHRMTRPSRHQAGDCREFRRKSGGESKN